MTEIWKDIEGYEGLYQISNLGNVKSLARLKGWGAAGKIYVKEMLLKQRKSFCHHYQYIPFQTSL